MDFSSKFYHDACIPCKKLQNVRQFADALEKQFPKFSFQKNQLNAHKIRIDMVSRSGFLKKILGNRLAITVNAEIKNKNLLLNYSNAAFIGKFIVLCCSAVLIGIGIAFDVLAASQFLLVAIYSATGRSAAGPIIYGILLLLASLMIYAITIGNIIGFIRQIRLGKRITAETVNIISNNLIAPSTCNEDDDDEDADVEDEPAESDETGACQNTSMQKNYLKRAFIFLEDGMFEKADEYCEKALDFAPENAQAYLGKLMAEYKICQKEDVAVFVKKHDVRGSNNYKRYLKYATEKEMLIMVQAGKCPQCGMAVDADMSFCASCGCRLEW